MNEKGLQPGRWSWVPFLFLPAALFTSRLFVVFSPLPLLWLAFSTPSGFSRRTHSFIYALAGATNLAFVYWMNGPADAAFYGLTAGCLGLVIPIALVRFRKINAAVTASFLTVFGIFLVLIALGSALVHHNIFIDLKNAMNIAIDESLQSLPNESRQALLGDVPLGEWKDHLWHELPWVGCSYLLLLVVVNLGLLVRLNPGKLRTRLSLGPHLFRTWQAPEWLLWPTIIAGFFALMDWNRVTWFGTNFLKFSLSVYSIQGLSIMSSLFSAWKLKRIWRWLGYGLVASVMTPIVLTLGFFDQWFDFRKRFRQT